MSTTDLDKFKTEPDQAALAHEWGSAAAAKLGGLRARIKRMLNPLSPDDRRQAWHWFNTTSLNEYRAILRQLTSVRAAR